MPNQTQDKQTPRSVFCTQFIYKEHK